MITEGAILIAAALVLGLWKFFELPQGGSINLEMLPILIFVIRWGFPNSLEANFADAFGSTDLDAYRENYGEGYLKMSVLEHMVMKKILENATFAKQ